MALPLLGAAGGGAGRPRAPARQYSYRGSRPHEAAETLIAHASRFRARWAIDPDFLRADAVKIFADGVIEYPTQTAALLEPYLDAHGRPTRSRGPSYFTQANLNRIVTAADV